MRWPVVFEEYRNAAHLKRQGDYASLRVTLNTRLAETFTARVELMSDPEALMARRERYGCEVPDSFRVIVAAVDTQASWLEWLVCGIAPQSELFLLDRDQINGRIETSAEDVYARLDAEVLNRRWKRSDGKLMPLFRCFQDAAGALGAKVPVESVPQLQDKLRLRRGVQNRPIEL